MKKNHRATLKPITEHCYALAETLVSFGEYDMLQTSNWLQVASSVKSVGIDLVRYDKQFGWCSGADEYTMAKETIFKDFVTNLSIFTFTWGALESAIDQIDPPPHPDKNMQGKINSACYYICNHFKSRLLVKPYRDLLSRFQSKLSQSIACGALAKTLKIPHHIRLEAFGLYAVYKVRNMLAHGGMSFPEPEPKEHRAISPDPILIETATRILLLSMQMLLIAHYAGRNLTVERERSGEEKDVPLTEWLRVLHYSEVESEDSFI